MEHNQDRDQSQAHSQRKVSEDSQKGPTGRLEVVDTTEKFLNLRASPLRKKLFNPAVDSRRMVSPVTKAAASHLTTTGMRKSQSVQNLHTEVDMPLTLSRPSKEVAPLPHHSQFHHSQASEGQVTLPTSPQPQDNTSTSHSTATMPRSLKSRCSYMSPTTSSMAKMSRSVSMGDNLNVTEEESGSGSSSNTSIPPTTKSQSCSSHSPSTKASFPVAMVSSASSSLSGMGLAMPQAAVIPNLIASSNPNPTTKSLQAKLTCSTQPQLNLDISKSLPDKPSLAVFTPNGTSKTTTTSYKTVKEDNLSPPVSSLPQQGQNQPPPLFNNVQLVIALSPSPAPPWETSPVLSPEAEQLGLTAELRPEAPVVDNRLEQPNTEESQGLTQEESPVTELSLQGNPVYLLSQRGPSQDRTEDSLSMESCKVLASELQNSFRKASRFYRMVNSVPVASRQEQHEMARVLSEAFEVVRAELSSLPQSSLPSPSGEPAAGGSLCTLGCRPVGPGTGGSGSGEERTLALLEQYSELLLKAVEKRLDNNQVS
ncbi:unnamed protein product [Oncorhynchus mykiss]|uniref:Uncharacterized protein n=2 Tax=Oncorhynchus mykiss TaxID=8022 RepID=A0A060WNU8_ONCMY|nr:unnamed protein product [Oncorhynchus mykiss]